VVIGFGFQSSIVNRNLILAVILSDPEQRDGESKDPYLTTIRPPCSFVSSVVIGFGFQSSIVNRNLILAVILSEPEQRDGESKDPYLTTIHPPCPPWSSVLILNRQSKIVICSSLSS
jgi:hypothetical protein